MKEFSCTTDRLKKLMKKYPLMLNGEVIELSKPLNSKSYLFLTI